MMDAMKWFWIAFLSMMPVSELRGAIPLAVGKYGMNPWVAVPLIVLLNFVPVPFLLIFLQPVERWLRGWRFWSNLLDKIFEHTRKRTTESIERWETLALILFVAVPLPVTGAWTGSLAAYLFGLEIKKSMLCIFAGICIAALIVTAATMAGTKILGL